MTLLISDPRTFSPIDATPKVVKHPIKAPGTNHSAFILACQHIDADIIPVMITDRAIESGIKPEINTAIRENNIPEKVERIVVFIPSNPCFPEAK